MILSWKYMVVIGVSVLLVGAGVTLGFEYVDVDQSDGPVTVETVSGPLKLEMTIDKTVYTIGETVNITITLTNISNETLELVYRRTPRVSYIVYNGSFESVFVSEAAGAALLYDLLLLEANECYGYIYSWGQIEFGNDTWLQTCEQVEPGTYFIVAKTGWGLNTIQPYGISKIETSKIQIEIVS